MANDDGIDCSKDEVRTQQSGKDECDINLIVARAKRGANIDIRDRIPQYGDFTQIPKDLRECMLIVKQAETAFMSLDAFVRRRFDNDPAKMLDFLNDPANRDEAVSLNLVKAPPVKEDVSVEVTPVKESSGAKKSKAKADDE